MQDQGKSVVQSSEVKSSERKVLVEREFLKIIMKGWYYISNPAENDKDTTMWYSNFWTFLQLYCKSRFGNEYILNAEQSLFIHTNDTIIPKQVSVAVRKNIAQIVSLPFGNSILFYHDKNFSENVITKYNGLNIYSLEYVVTKLTPSMYKSNPQNIYILYNMVNDYGKVLDIIENSSQGESIANKVLGTLLALGKDDEANILKNVFSRLYTNVKPVDWFSHKELFQEVDTVNPISTRLNLLWKQNREKILNVFSDISTYDQSVLINDIEKYYADDAYNSLSIEGYKVTRSLIEKVASGNWDPQNEQTDAEQKNKLAAKGYYLTFKEVEKLIGIAVDSDDPIKLLKKNFQTWYMKLFEPCANAGIIKNSDLVGYRRHQVYIRNSLHIPFDASHLSDAMDEFFKILQQEKEPIVRAIIGHFLFTYIHPFPDGNGRIGRFIMNYFMLQANLPWTVIKVENRNRYMDALETASVKSDIEDFAKFMRLTLNEQLLNK